MSLNEAAAGEMLKLPGAHFKQQKCFKESTAKATATTVGAGASEAAARCRVLGKDCLKRSARRHRQFSGHTRRLGCD